MIRRLFRFIDKAFLFVAGFMAILIYSPVLITIIIVSALKSYRKIRKVEATNPVDEAKRREVEIWSKVLGNIRYLKEN